MRDRGTTTTGERETLLQRVREVLERDLGTPAHLITEESHLIDDLGMDSFQLTELVLVIEEEFGVPADTSDFEGAATLGDALDIIQALRRGG
jgi:acyl carrier protein